MITSFCKSMCDFSFRGRSARKEVLSFFILWLVLSMILLTAIVSVSVCSLGLNFSFENGLSMPASKMNIFSSVWFVILCITSVIFVVFNIWAFISASLLSIRRLHDMNYSGVCYWVWLSSLLLFGTAETSTLTIFTGYFLIAGIIAIVTVDSYPAKNKYGESRRISKKFVKI